MREEDYEDNQLTVVLVGLKSDLKVNHSDKIIKWCKKNKVPYIETSAKENVNVEFAFRYGVFEFFCKNNLRVDWV